MLLGGHVVGYGLLGGVTFAGLVNKGGVAEQVGQAVKLRFLADGQLERGHAGAESGVQLLEDAGKIGPFPVQLVHEDEAGDPELGCRFPENLGLHLDAVDGADDEHGQVGHGQPGERLRYEVGIARAVQDIDLVAAPLRGGQCERGGHVMGVLFGLEVGHGGPVLDPARPRDRTTAKEHGFGERRLPRAPVADQGHVADLRWWVRLHESTSFCSEGPGPTVSPSRPL